MTQIPTRTSHPRQLASKQTGDMWEPAAHDWLLGKGPHFIAANVHGRSGEIDLIVREGDIIIFVEVRYRRSTQFGGAAASVTQSKQYKLLQAIHLWLARRNGSFGTADCRFDVLAFIGNDVEQFKDASDNRSQLKIQSLVLEDQRVRWN